MWMEKVLEFSLTVKITLLYKILFCFGINNVLFSLKKCVLTGTNFNMLISRHIDVQISPTVAL